MQALDTREVKRDSSEKAKRALEKLLRLAKDCLCTGEGYLHLTFNQGGVARAVMAIENEEK